MNEEREKDSGASRCSGFSIGSPVTYRQYRTFGGWLTITGTIKSIEDERVCLETTDTKTGEWWCWLSNLTPNG